MAYKKYYKKRNNYKSKKQDDAETKLIAIVIMIFLLWFYWIYNNYIKPNIDNILLLTKIFIPILIISIVLIIIYKKKKKKIIIEEQKEKFPQLILEIEEKIRGFKPLRSYNHEEPYQIELAWYLKNNYPNLDIEKSIDYSRPDIIIDKIAIEIKWPTNMQALKTIPDKINSYLPKRDFLFIVLFNINIIDYDKEKNMDIYYEKKKEILENTIESKRDKIIFIEIKS